jgi:hypothetical protein
MSLEESVGTTTKQKNLAIGIETFLGQKIFPSIF